MKEWRFNAGGRPVEFVGPIALARKGMGLPPACGTYAVTSADCISHIGTSGSLRTRVGSLARLGKHRGSAEVLCAAYCTREEPLVWWHATETIKEARSLEAALKQHHGEPPQPRRFYESCRDGAALRAALLSASGAQTWAAGFIEALFTVGEELSLLQDPRLDYVWDQMRRPPGPWAAS